MTVKVRKKVMLRDNNEFQRCKEQGMFSIGQCVHHKKELKKHPELALDINNLTVLCNKCNNIIHEKGAMKKGCIFSN